MHTYSTDAPKGNNNKISLSLWNIHRAKRIRLKDKNGLIFYLFIIANKSCKKTKIANGFITKYWHVKFDGDSFPCGFILPTKAPVIMKQI